MKDLQLKNCRLNERYNIRDLLGRGSYAEIYIAEDIHASPQTPHQTVVIKALNVFLQNDLDHDLERTLVENFQNEAIALDRVRHPNIISRLGHGTARDLQDTVFHYLVLEYLPGGDLAKYCRTNQLTVNQALDYLEQICAGIAHAHKNNVIHRDLKPQNLLLTEDKKVVKIADFGVARLTQSISPVTRVGTNMYAPPEHSPLLSGETGNLTYKDLTPAADIYSLAKTAYVLFTSESPRYLANHPVTELPFAFRNKPWAENLVSVLNKATQNDSRERYQNVNEFWKELSTLRLLADEPGAEVATRVSARQHRDPQPQFAEGYNPSTPMKPKFDTSRELKLKPHLTVGQGPPLVVQVNETNPLLPKKPKSTPVKETKPPIPPGIKVPEPRQRKAFRFFAAFIIFVSLFAGSLYATYTYMVNNGYSLFGSSDSGRLGIATTNVNLRSGPSTSNGTIGLVTKNSRVRVVKIENNWYQVVIIEHGSPKRDPNFADEGWAFGRFIEIDGE
ncbi:MAG: protein kinase [Pyrinomonadaceae bacterium]|nr:protein kinase [Pyrinomonadaceae bacterium]